MAKDYARGSYSSHKSKKRKPKTTAQQSSKRKSHKKSGRTFLRPALLFSGFLFVGILVGLFIAGLTYLSHHKASHIASATTMTTPTKSTQEQLKKTALTHKKATTQSAVAKPHFDFYTILPNQKVENPTKDESLQTQPQEEYILQVASVKDFQDADRLRAQLLLLGYEVFINKSLSGKIAWHRVNVGPYKTLKDAEKKQDDLRNNQINSLLLKRSKNHA